MKTKILTLMLLVCFLLSACGSEAKDTSTTNEVEVSSEVESEEDVTVDEEVVVEVAVAEEAPAEETPIEDPTEEVEVPEDAQYIDAYAWMFPEGMDGFTNKWVYEGGWSYNKTHYVDPRGREMNFIWEGPVELGEQAVQDVNTLALYGANAAYELRAWHGGEVTSEDFQSCLELTKEEWVSFASDSTPYPTNGYYDIQTTDTTIEVVFEVANENYKGYNYYITDLENAHCYQFAYLESVDVYDDARAMKVIESLAFWTDYPTNE